MLQHRRLVGWVTVLSGVIGLVSYVLVAGAVNYNFEFFGDSSLIFTTDGVNSAMLKWSMITDVFGYYLLLLPVLFFIHEWLNGQSAWRNMISFCGLSYIIAGAIGASVLSAASPALLDKFPMASPEQQDIIKLSFHTLSWVVVDGIWNMFDALVFAVWFISIGIFLKVRHAFWGWLTILIGLLSALDFMGNIFDVKSLAEAALNLYLILAPLWAILIGFKILQNKIFLSHA